MATNTLTLVCVQLCQRILINRRFLQTLQTCFDLALDASDVKRQNSGLDWLLQRSILGRSVVSPTILDLKKVNSIIKCIKEECYCLRFRRGAKALTVFADSAGPRERMNQMRPNYGTH
jgi:hypothetical protein